MKTLLFGLSVALVLAPIAQAQQTSPVAGGEPKQPSPAVAMQPAAPPAQITIYSRSNRVWTDFLKHLDECQRVVTSVQQEAGIAAPISDQLGKAGAGLGTVRVLADQQMSSIQAGIKEDDFSEASFNKWRQRSTSIYYAGQSALSQVQAIQLLLNQIKVGSLSPTDTSRLASAFSATLDSTQHLNPPILKTQAERDAFKVHLDKVLADSKKFDAESDEWDAKEKIITAQQHKDIAAIKEKSALIRKLVEAESLPADKRAEKLKSLTEEYKRLQREGIVPSGPPQQAKTIP